MKKQILILSLITALSLSLTLKAEDISVPAGPPVDSIYNPVANSLNPAWTNINLPNKYHAATNSSIIGSGTEISTVVTSVATLPVALSSSVGTNIVSTASQSVPVVGNAVGSSVASLGSATLIPASSLYLPASSAGAFGAGASSTGIANFVINLFDQKR